MKATLVGSNTKDQDFMDFDDYDDEDEVDRKVVRSPLVVGFEYDIAVSWTESASVRWRMEISFDSLADKVVLLSSDGAIKHFYLFLANQPKLYRGAPQQRRFLLDLDDVDAEVNWERDVTFGSCERHIVCSCNAFGN